MALKGKQKNIDANKDGRISGEDFKILRSRPLVTLRVSCTISSSHPWRCGTVKYT